MRKYVVAVILLLNLQALAFGQSIEKRVLDQVKDATVFIKLKAGRLQGSGSGFVMKVTGDTILVMTNRHVAAPATGELPAGEKVELAVVLRSGTPQQQELPARLLAYDERDVRDLAVLEVRGVRTPPLPIAADQTAAETDFFETMQVYALGFPLGSLIQGVVDNRTANPAITVTQMTISSLRRDEANRLARVQLNGSLIEGNSGGPIVDTKGRLVGVAVSRLRGESVGFAIPPSVIAGFLSGDIGGLAAELVAAQAGNVQVKLSLRLVDPLGNLRGVAVRYARQPATPSPAQADARGNWPLLAGGTSVPLTVAKGAAGGQVNVPIAKPEDRKLLVQFVLTDVAGRTIASKPTSVSLPERPGSIEGLAEIARPKTMAKWSCEVNMRDGAKISHSPGKTMIDLPGTEPMANSPQYKLFNAPGALIRVDGDFIGIVKVANEFDPGAEVITLTGGKKLPITFQGAGLLIWQDDKNFVRLERCKGSDGGYGQIHRILVEMYKGGKEVVVLYTKPLPERTFVLGARRKGSTIQLLFADSPERLIVFRELALDFDKELFVGVAASNLSKRPFQAKFEDFTLKGDDGQDVPVKPVALTRLDGGPVRRSDGTWVVEGATMKVIKSVGDSVASPQTHMDQFKGKWTDDRQLLWRAERMGNSLVLELPVDVAGKYEIKGLFTLSPDYGKVNFALDGKSLIQGKSRDFYYKETRPARAISLGAVNLDKGKHRFTVTVSGKNPSANGYAFGLDEIQLVPAH